MYAHPHPYARCFAMSHGRRGSYGRSWGPPPHRGPRARRGDVRAALLLLLAEQPRNGYQLMQEIEERSDGAWRPSPGSIYPALQQLEDERLVRTVDREGGRAYELTDAGRRWVAEREGQPAPWEAVRDEVGTGPRQLMRQLRDVAMAATEIVRSGDDAQIAKAQQLLRDTRRGLYRLLADDE